MKYHLKIELQGLPKTINAIGRTHWAIKANEAKYWRRQVAYAVIMRKPKQPLKKAKITYTRYSSVAPDSDNLAASFKSVQDGLIDGKIIENDKYVNIGMPTYKWEKSPPGLGKIFIEVEEI